MRASSLPLTGAEIYKGCRTPSMDSKFSASPASPDLGPSSSTARELYQGFASTSEWSEFSQTSTDAEDEGDHPHSSNLIQPRKKLNKIFRFLFAIPDSTGKRDAIEDTKLDDSAAASVGSPCYKRADIERITHHFRQPIGRGETSKNVYIGKLVDGTKVAVKVFPSESWHSTNHFNEFKFMVEKFALLKHNNLVPIIGYCFEESTSALIMEHMPGGNLTKFIVNPVGFNREHQPLTWVQRLQIALDVAQGLEYLHQSYNPPVTYGNVRMTNILLDENLNAKLAEPGSTIFSHFQEYRDVYDFGVVLWYLITGAGPSVLKASYLTDYDIMGRTWKLPCLSLDNYSSFCSLRKVPISLISVAKEFCNLRRRPGRRGRPPLPSIFYSSEVCVCPVIMIAGACTFVNFRDRPAMNLVVNDLKVCLNVARMEGRVANSGPCSEMILSLVSDPLL